MTGFTVRRLGLPEVADRTPEFEAIYAAVYREAPYNEGPEQAADFIKHLADQREQPGFSMVIAEAADGALVGFAYGFTFTPERWWRHASDEPDLTRGRPKFAVMEFAVLPQWQGNRIGTALMTSLLLDRPEPFGTLCANPSALASSIYRLWGWQQVATSHPPHMGLMEVLVKQLAPDGVHLRSASGEHASRTT